MNNTKTNKKNENIYITNHANDRAKERLGIAPKSVERMADKILKSGIQVEETTGKLYNYMKKKEENKMHKGDTYIIYGEYIYVFQKVKERKNRNKNVLITMYLLPTEYKKKAAFLKKKIRPVSA